MIARRQAWAVVRKNAETGAERVDISTVDILPEMAKEKADHLDKYLSASNWAKAHPQQRTVKIDIVEVSQ